MLAAGAYVVVRLMHLVLFFVAGRDDAGIRAAVLSFARAVIVAGVLLLAGAYVGGGWQMVLVALAMVIDVLGPFLGRGQGWHVALGHFAERHALIVIIALGESIVAIGVGASGLPFTGPLLVLSLVGVALACAFWVAYFTGTDTELEAAVARREGVARVTAARDVYSVMHFLLVAGLILVALAVKSAMKGSDDGWTTPLAFYASFALGVGVFQFLGGLWAMRRRSGHATAPAELVLALAALALIPVALVVPAAVALCLAVALVATWRGVRA
jgi:low temperature requirement protein LtrA